MKINNNNNIFKKKKEKKKKCNIKIIAIKSSRGELRQSTNKIAITRLSCGPVVFLLKKKKEEEKKDI